MIGKTLSHYQVLEALGKGGMGEVYRARDTKLDREVAIKVLPEDFARDRDRVSRFTREAKLLAALSHPNIAGIYGLEDEGETRFIAMELVEGETLADRIARSGRIEIDEALGIARQIAEALEAAHRSGVIHRDLKPANVIVTPGGQVKVLDFGLAKAYEASSAMRDLHDSPTMPVSSHTASGIILGTAAYMSPEQARGKPVDKRGDIFAYGAVLYEMLAGAAVFGGEMVTDVLASVVKQDPDWAALPAETPPPVQSLLRRCLQKDPARRLHDIADARIEIEEIASGASESAPAGISPARRRRPMLWMGAGLLIGAVLAAAGLQLREPTRTPAPVVRLSMTLPADARMSEGLRSSMAVLPDGRGIVYSGVRNGAYWLFRRDFDAETPEPIPGTQGGDFPFFSPDGRWLGFSDNKVIMKVPAEGGTPISIHPGTSYFGVAWTREGYLVASPIFDKGLKKIPEAGGEATDLTTPAEGELGHWWPSLLPDGRHVLFTCWRHTLDDASVRVVSLDTGEQRELIQNAFYARYLPTGHLVFGRGSALLAVPFDAKRLELTGSPVVVLDSVYVKSGDGTVLAAFTNDGTLVYRPASIAASHSLVRVEPGPDAEHPTVEPILEGERNDQQVAVSPDGRHLALGIHTGTQDDIWVLDMQRAALTRLTFDGTNSVPIWTPDGREITFRSLRNGPYEIFQIPEDGSRKERKLYGTSYDLLPTSWSPDHRLLFESSNNENRDDIWVLDTSGTEPKAEVYLATKYNEGQARFSPDGKWILYMSEASGRPEVYLQSYPAQGGRQQVSVNGGHDPMWSSDGKTVFYRSGSRLLRARITFTPRPEIGSSVVLLDEAALPGTVEGWDNTPGGDGFVGILEKKGTEQPLRVVQNWFQEVERLTAAGN